MDFRFDGECRYQLSVRLTAGMEFVELDERIDGFRPEDDVALEFDWDAIGWTHRYCANRSDGPIEPDGSGYDNFAWEPVASGLGPGGALPIELVPYHSWLTWWRLPAAAFWAEPHDVSLGVFITDHERWDDGEWAVWGSSVTLAGRFFFDSGRLRWRFPLAAGARALAVATYPHAQDVRTVTDTGIPLTHIDTLYRWHGWLPLNKVKDWTLDPMSSRGRATPDSSTPHTTSCRPTGGSCCATWSLATRSPSTPSPTAARAPTTDLRQSDLARSPSCWSRCSTRPPAACPKPSGAISARHCSSSATCSRTKR
jgi:hypothetical protein